MKMQNVEMEFVTFDAQDVIATSGELTFTVAGLGDGIARNATIVTSDGRKIYNANDYTLNWSDQVAAALKNEVEGKIFAVNTKFCIDSSTSETINILFSTSILNGDGSSTLQSKWADYNGIYKWISESSSFMKQ